MPIINTVIAGGGTTPTGTKTITTNGTHDVAAYEYADVQVPTTAPAKYVAYDVNASGELMVTGPLIDLSGVTKITDYALSYAYYKAGFNSSLNNTKDITIIGPSGMLYFNDSGYITGDLDLSSVTLIDAYGLSCAFRNSTLNGSVDLSSVTTVEHHGLFSAFEGAAITSIDLSSLEQVTGVSSGWGLTLARICYNSASLTSVNLSKLKVIEPEYCCQNAFYMCNGITYINLGSLERIGTSTNDSSITKQVCETMFYKCTGLTQVDLGKLKSIKGNAAANNMFTDCINLTKVNLRSLEYISGASTTSTGNAPCGNFFKGCTSLIEQKFESLTTVGRYSLYGAFVGDTALQSVWFYALANVGAFTNSFTSMLSGCTNVTVHFPMAIQATIGSWSDVTNGFSGTNTTVLFDIVTSLTGADTNTYTRQEKDSTATATAWNDGNDVLFYTSGVSDNTNGVNEPVVGDTIYSDAACTTAVTTISTIA